MASAVRTDRARAVGGTNLGAEGLPCPRLGRAGRVHGRRLEVRADAVDGGDEGVACRAQVGARVAEAVAGDTHDRRYRRHLRARAIEAAHPHLCVPTIRGDLAGVSAECLDERRALSSDTEDMVWARKVSAM